MREVLRNCSEPSAGSIARNMDHGRPDRAGAYRAEKKEIGKPVGRRVLGREDPKTQTGIKGASVSEMATMHRQRWIDVATSEASSEAYL